MGWGGGSGALKIHCHLDRLGSVALLMATHFIGVLAVAGNTGARLVSRPIGSAVAPPTDVVDGVTALSTARCPNCRHPSRWATFTGL